MLHANRRAQFQPVNVVAVLAQNVGDERLGCTKVFAAQLYLGQLDLCRQSVVTRARAAGKGLEQSNAVGDIALREIELGKRDLVAERLLTRIDASDQLISRRRGPLDPLQEAHHVEPSVEVGWIGSSQRAKLLLRIIWALLVDIESDQLKPKGALLRVELGELAQQALGLFQVARPLE